MAKQFEWDVFISHTSKDKPRVRSLAARLRSAGLRIWLDEWVIEPGMDIYSAIEDGLEKSRTLILCMSKAAFGSDWVQLERGTVIFRDPQNKQRRFVPVLLEDCEIRDTLRRYSYIDWRHENDDEWYKLLSACSVPENEDLKLDKLGGPVKHKRLSCDIWVSNEGSDNIEDYFGGGAEEVKYFVIEKDGTMLIGPICPYLTGLYEHRQVEQVYTDGSYNSFFDLNFPELDLKMVNNSADTVFISRVNFQVEKSQLDQRPIPIFETDWTKLFQFRLINEGWGDMKDAIIKYEIFREDEEPDGSRDLTLTKTIDSFVGYLNVDFSSDLKTIGIDVETIQQINTDCMESRVEWDDFQESLAKAKGVYKDCENLVVAGILTYDQLNPDGRLGNYKVCFSVRIPITPPEGLGGVEPSTGSYDVLLDSHKDDYTVVAPVSHSIKSGAVDRFILRVGALQSSIHKFRIKLISTNGDEFISRPIILSLFVPRRNAQDLAGETHAYDDETLD